MVFSSFLLNSTPRIHQEKKIIFISKKKLKLADKCTTLFYHLASESIALLTNEGVIDDDWKMWHHLVAEELTAHPGGLPSYLA